MRDLKVILGIMRDIQAQCASLGNIAVEKELKVILDTMCDSHAQYASLARSDFPWFPMYPARAEFAAVLHEYILYRCHHMPVFRAMIISKNFKLNFTYASESYIIIRNLSFNQFWKTWLCKYTKMMIFDHSNMPCHIASTRHTYHIVSCLGNSENAYNRADSAEYKSHARAPNLFAKCPGLTYFALITHIH